ncbi:oxidoreductase [Streptomyces sp. HUAS MG47]|uniref:oxidoreductase n=1 Tax=Streptomyces solicamelliae TaxID=3231716 RepID=UPI003877C41E
MLTYDQLTPPERRLWDAFPEGRLVDLRAGDPGTDDPVGDAEWPESRSVRAAVVAALLLGANAAPSGAVPALRLAGARITGRLDLSGAELAHALSLEGCRLDETVSLAGATARTVRIKWSRLPGVDAHLARIEGSFGLRGSVLRGDGLVLSNATVAGEVNLADATISGRRTWAVLAGGLSAGGAVFAERLTTVGGVRMPGASLPRGLFLTGAVLRNPGGDALSAGQLSASTVDCSAGFTATGTVRFRNARIEDLLSFEDATLRGELVGTALQAGDLDLRTAEPPGGTVDLRSARVTSYRDREDSWPAQVLLEGFVYDALRSGETFSRIELRRRLAWVARHPGYAPQPYEQLAAWYRQMGHETYARRVILEKHRRHRRTLHFTGRLWGRMLDVTVGYGFRPWLAGLWLAALSLCGTLVFRAHTPTPVKPGEGSPFQPFVYTLDLLVPFGGLGQRTAWYWKDDVSQWLAYGLVGAGWLLTTAVVAGVTRILSRN